EECSPLAALRQWCQLVRYHLGRLFLYEGLALALGLAATLPFAIPALLTLYRGPLAPPSVAADAARALLFGLAATPLIAYLAVANVFIYVNLRYEYSARG